MQDVRKIKFKDFLKTIVRVFKFAIKVDKRRFWILVFNQFVMAGSSILTVYIFALFLNEAIYQTDKNFFSQKLILFVLAYLLIQFINNLNVYWFQRVNGRFYRNIFLHSSLERAKASERIDIQTYESPGFELLKTRVNMHFGKLEDFIDSVLESISSLVPIIITTVIIASLQKWWLVFLIIIPSLINLYVEILDGNTLWDSENQAQEDRKKFGNVSSFFRNKNFIEEIKIHGLKDFLTNSLTKSRAIIDSIYNKRDEKYSKKKLYANIFTNLVDVFVPLILIYQVFTKSLLIGAFWFINDSFNRFENSFRRGLRMFSRMYRLAPYVYDVLNFMELEPVLNNGNKSLGEFDNLVIKNLSFTYPDSDRETLKKFNITINRGDKIALIGLNGAGKTTLTKLLLRFYLPTSGELKYNGTNIEDVEKDSLYKNIGFLPQDFAKFDLTFEEAILLGNIKDRHIHKKVIEAAKQAGIHEYIMSFKNGYKTQIGKKYQDGIELSGGQWQKLAIARLFYRNAKLWILDEPTSAIDADAETKIFEQLESLPKDITVIMISHRFSTVRNADKICVINDGRVYEYGTHEELLTLNGEYARLFNLQAEGYK